MQVMMTVSKRSQDGTASSSFQILLGSGHQKLA